MRFNLTETLSDCDDSRREVYVVKFEQFVNRSESNVELSEFSFPFIEYMV